VMKLPLVFVPGKPERQRLIGHSTVSNTPVLTSPFAAVPGRLAQLLLKGSRSG